MHETRAKTNRLRRGVRASQAADRLCSPGDKSGQTPLQHDLQSPVRVQSPVRSRISTGASTESSLNESSSDLHQDIIWDNTSPSPHRLGKRGSRAAGRVVNISDIVSRIAPETGRPRVLEPTLQQWIGDSATIPCTPELQPPKPKRKSPRPNGVDDLLRLAKQFDFNMLYEIHPGPDSNQHLDLDLPTPHNPKHNPNQHFNLDLDLPTPHNPNQESNQHLNLDSNLPTPHNPTQEPHMEWLSDEDLDYLFDRSTQSAGGAFSQSLPTTNTAQTKAPAGGSGEASGDVSDAKQAEHPGKKSQTNLFNVHVSPTFQHGSISEAKTMKTFTQKPDCFSKSGQNQTKTFKFKSSSSSETVPKLVKSPEDCGFDDDWGKDDLMDDSLLMEITQNPLGFTSPKCTSTQRNGGKINGARRTFTLTTNMELSAEGNAEFDPELSETAENTRKSKSTKLLDRTLDTKQNSSHKPQSFSNFQTGCASNFAENSSVGFLGNSSPNRPLVNGFGAKPRAQLTNETSNSAAKSGPSYGKSQQRFGAYVAQTALNSQVNQCVSSANNCGTRSDAFSIPGMNSASSFGKRDSSKDSGETLQRGFRANVASTGSDAKSRQDSSSGNGFGERTLTHSTRFSAENVSNGVNGGASLGEDFPDEDLDSIFSSEPQWDDDEDDDLLCELCDDVETQMQESEMETSASDLGTKRTERVGQKPNENDQGANQRTGQWTNQIQSKASPQNITAQSDARDDFTFKRPNPVSARVMSKCSAAEIELKKQQAMERRRQRQLMTNNQPITSQMNHNQAIINQRNHNQPVTSQRNQHQPTTSQRNQHQPITSQINHNQPVINQRNHNQAITSQMNHHQPIVSQRNHNQPFSNQRNHNQPIVSQRNHHQPIVNQRNHHQPIVNQRNHNQPIVSQRNHHQPIVSQMNHNQPIIGQRNHNQPIVSQMNRNQAIVSQMNHNQPIVSQMNRNQAIVSQRNRFQSQGSIAAPT